MLRMVPGNKQCMGITLRLTLLVPSSGTLS
jgi:hypothetical protein